MINYLHDLENEYVEGLRNLVQNGLDYESANIAWPFDMKQLYAIKK